VTYTMQPLSEQPGHRFGVNRILRRRRRRRGRGRAGRRTIKRCGMHTTQRTGLYRWFSMTAKHRSL